MKKEYKLIIIAAVALLCVFAIQKTFKSKEVIDTSEPVVKMPDEVKVIQQGSGEVVQVRFYWEIQGIKYNDALYIPKDKYEKMGQGELDGLKKERFDNWVKSINENSKADE